MVTKVSHLIPALLTVLILDCLLATCSSNAAAANITTDQSALLSLKTHVASYPYGVLESWTIHSTVCNWIGVTCGKRHHRVSGLNISNLDLTGSIPPEIGNLSFLVSLDIGANNFGKNLPEELVRLQRLRFINLGRNNFTGEVPSWFSSLPRLQYVHLSNNSFTSFNSCLLSSTNESKLISLDVSFNPFGGEIPKSIGKFHHLKTLLMKGNRFSGSLPASIMNISSLEILSLFSNSLQGTIPEDIGELHNLKRLNLQNNQLGGSIPSGIFNISMLEMIALTGNNLSGNLPNDMCVGLPVLRELTLSLNRISGQIPSNLSLCPELQILSLSYNVITGTIPQEIGSVEMLEILTVGGNQLTGSIPLEIGKLHNLLMLAMEKNLLTGPLPSTIFNMSFLRVVHLNTNEFNGHLTHNLGNLTMLTRLDLSSNNFTGVIPSIFDKHTKLEFLSLQMNGFSGPIPSCIFNISTMSALSLIENSFSGNLPANIGLFLPSLQKLILAMNNLDGVVPSSISNASQLQSLELALNNFTGSVPNSLGDLKYMEYLSLSGNNFSSESNFIASLTRLRNLKDLVLDLNPLNGILSTAIGNLSSSLEMFSVMRCKINGYIPNEIGNLSALVTLDLRGNDLSGVIPSTFGNLSNLQRVYLERNRLTGFIPSALCKLKSLGEMSFGQNQLIGSIPECLGNISSLRYIYLNSNNLTSRIPASIWSMQYLLKLDVSSNTFIGSLSPQIGNLKEATLINLSGNQFSDDIPNTFEGLQRVESLSLAYNTFQGPIPKSIGSMLSLTSLDLSHNMLSGTIPKSVESLSQLKYFNVSFNKLSGEIPTGGPFKNLAGKSFVYNEALCGPPQFQVSSCPVLVHKSNRKKILEIVFIILGIGASTFICTMAFLMVRYRRNRKSATVSNILGAAKPTRISYYDLLKATNGYSEGNLLGSGSFGSVYKGVLEDGTILAIKVFAVMLEVASKTFDAECNALRNLRHRNLIEVISSCSNHDFKAIVLEYMPNGSLDKWLHLDNCFLDIMKRLNIMIDVGNALEYLHHGYSVPVVHCDLKPSNVLMDENMVAHLSDFGITKFLDEEQSITHTRTLATLGYMSPEYGSEGKVSTRCDVYSYGLMLLETFTNKRPFDEMFSEDMNLKNWVKDSLPNAPSQVIDASLISPEEMSFNEKLCCVSSVLQLALRCCTDSPQERMNIKDALAQLKKIKAKYVEHYRGTSNMW